MRLRSLCGVAGSLQSLGKSVASESIFWQASPSRSTCSSSGAARSPPATAGRSATSRSTRPRDRRGHQPVVRVHLHVPTSGEFRLIARTFHLLTAKGVRYFAARPKLSLDAQGLLEGEGTDGFQEQVADRRIDSDSPDGLTGFRPVVRRLVLAEVARDPFAAPAQVVADTHAPSTPAANDKPLKKGRPFPRRPLLAFLSHPLSVRRNPLLVLLILLPGEVPRKRFGKENEPLLPREPLPLSRGASPAATRSAVAVCSVVFFYGVPSRLLARYQHVTR